MVKAIIFDCFGVLATDLWKEFVASLPPEQQSEASSLNRAYDGAHLSKQEFFEAVQTLTGRLPAINYDAFDEDTTKNTQLLNLIGELKKSYKISILSNVGTNWIRDYFLTADEQGLFDDILASYQVGLTKPDEKIFELAANRLGVAPAECVFVDDIDGYCRAAEMAGMRGITYQDFTQMKSELEKILSDPEG